MLRSQNSPDSQERIGPFPIGARIEVRPKEAAARIGCSVGFIYALMDDGVLEHRAIKRKGKERGIRLIKISSIEKFLSQEAAV
jgi:hypothetical protein